MRLVVNEAQDDASRLGAVGDLALALGDEVRADHLVAAADNVFDVLIPGLTLADLNPYDPSLIASTSFYYFDPTSGVTPFEVFEGALTSLTIADPNAVPEPGSLPLAAIGVIVLVLARRRLGAGR